MPKVKRIYTLPIQSRPQSSSLRDIIIISIIIAIGILVRLEDLYRWYQNPELAFYNGEPLFINFDGYYYLTLARDLLEGNYDRIDERRDVPVGAERRAIPPLLSLVTAGLKAVTPFSYMWIGALIPVFLGPLIAIPIYYLSKHLGGIYMAITSSLLTVVSYYYVYRSNLGWYDTDCLNVTFTVCAVYFSLMFGVTSDRRRYLYFVALLVNYLLFLWWWDSTPDTVTAITFTPFVFSLLLFYRPPRKEAIIFLSILLIPLLLLNIITKFEMPLRIVNALIGNFKYISVKDVVDIWPSIGATVSEQQKPEFMELVYKSSGNLLTFMCGILGIIVLMIRRHREGVLLSLLIALGILAVFYAKRFIIFLIPVIAIGVGFVISYVHNLSKRSRVIAYLIPVFVFILVFPSLKAIYDETFYPPEDPPLIYAFDTISKVTEKDAVIWAWWDHGYPILFWSNRGTIGDGFYHGGERSAYNALPYTTTNFKLAANFIHFYLAHGIPGIHKFYRAYDNDVPKAYALLKELLSKEPNEARAILEKSTPKGSDGPQTIDDWLRFLFPGETKPAYLLLDRRLLFTAYWWYWLGSWDPATKTGIHPYIFPLLELEKTEKGFISSDGIIIDIARGIIQVQNKEAYLKRLILVDAPSPYEIDYGRVNGGQVEIVPKYSYGAIVDDHIANSVFNQMFMRLTADSRHFEPVVIEHPVFSLWKVKGDKYP